MDIKVEQMETTGMAMVTVSGKATVRSADEAKAALLEALAGAPEVLLDVSGITGIDAAFLQLLCAAQKSAAAAGKPLRLEGGCSGTLARSFAEAGFSLPPGMAGTWTTRLSGGDER